MVFAPASAKLANSSNGMRCLSWRPYQRNTLLGFATIEHASGLVISDVTVHGRDGRFWAGPPARPKLDGDGIALRNRDTGKIAMHQSLPSPATSPAENGRMVLSLLFGAIIPKRSRRPPRRQSQPDRVSTIR